MRIGVIGAGKIGTLRAETIKNNPSTELAAVFDVSAQLAQGAVAGTGAKPVASLEAFLDTPMDAAIISTPPHLHEEAAVACYARGLHVLCEKPLSNTVEGGKRIVDAALAAGRVLATGFNMRYYPFAKFARETVEAGEIGTVDRIRVFGGHDGLHNFSADWQYKMPLSGGGAMMDVGIHMSDLARLFLGEVAEVSGSISERVYNLPGSEDTALALFRNADGIPASYEATWTEWKGYRSAIEIYGDKGMVSGAYAPMQNMLIVKGAKTVKKVYPEIMVREKLKSWKSTALLSFADELADFLAMTRGDMSVPLADGYAGLRTLEMAAAVRESSATSSVVKLAHLGRMPAVTPA